MKVKNQQSLTEELVIMRQGKKAI